MAVLSRLLAWREGKGMMKASRQPANESPNNAFLRPPLLPTSSTATYPNCPPATTAIMVKFTTLIHTSIVALAVFFAQGTEAAPVIYTPTR